MRNFARALVIHGTSDVISVDSVREQFARLEAPERFNDAIAAFSRDGGRSAHRP